jgi:hypothetical protein
LNPLDDVVERGSAVTHRLVVPVMADAHIPRYRRVSLRQGLPGAPLVIAKGIGLRSTESPWFRRRLGLLDFDQGLVVPLGSVERGFELCGWYVVEVAV